MAKPSFIPNLGVKKPVAPVAAPAAPVESTETKAEETNTMTETAETVVTAPVEKKKRKKADSDRQKPNRQLTSDDIIFVISNVKNMSYNEIAEARDITKHQVNRVLMDTKKRMRAAAADDPAKLASVEAYIKENLSRPEDTLPGAGRSSVVKDSINSIVDDLLAGVLK